MYTYQKRTTKKQIVVSISIFVPVLCFPFAYKVRIGIGTIEVTANTQQVLAVPTQTAKPLQEHRPSRVTSCPTGFGYRTLWQYLYEVSRLNGLALPKQLTVLLSKCKGPMASSSTNVFLCPILYPLTGFFNYEGYVIQQNVIRYRCSKKSVCRIIFWNMYVKY